MMNSLYGEKFYGGIADGSYRSAKSVFAILKQWLVVRSLADVGCGPGSWLRAAQEEFLLDSSKSVGFDGAWAQRMYHGGDIQFIACDLAIGLPPPSVRFDCLVCVEVAEHLPHNRAARFVSEVANYSDCVIFGAAIPNQGGIGHVNEQWPDYWRDLFSANGFVLYDVFRTKLWDDPVVCSWYAQNTFLYVREGSGAEQALRKAGMTSCLVMPLRAIHPGTWQLGVCESSGFGRLLRALPGSLKAAIERHGRIVWRRLKDM